MDKITNGFDEYCDIIESLDQIKPGGKKNKSKKRGNRKKKKIGEKISGLPFKTSETKKARKKIRRIKANLKKKSGKKYKRSVAGGELRCTPKGYIYHPIHNRIPLIKLYSYINNKAIKTAIDKYVKKKAGTCRKFTKKKY